MPWNKIKVAKLWVIGEGSDVQTRENNCDNPFMWIWGPYCKRLKSREGASGGRDFQILWRGAEPRACASIRAARGTPAIAIASHSSRAQCSIVPHRPTHSFWRNAIYLANLSHINWSAAYLEIIPCLAHQKHWPGCGIAINESLQSLAMFSSSDVLTTGILTTGSISRVAKTPSARQQCWPESFCKSGKFLRQVHYWQKNIRILCNTKYPDNMQTVRMNWKVSGQSKKCPDNPENVSG